jgi:hypothetical protein
MKIILKVFIPLYFIQWNDLILSGLGCVCAQFPVEVIVRLLCLVLVWSWFGLAPSTELEDGNRDWGNALRLGKRIEFSLFSSFLFVSYNKTLGDCLV